MFRDKLICIILYNKFTSNWFEFIILLINSCNILIPEILVVNILYNIYDWLSKNLPFLSFTPIGVRHTAEKPWVRAFQWYIIHWGSMTRMSSNLRRRRGSRVTRANSLKNSFLRNRALKFLDRFFILFLSARQQGRPKIKN